MGFWLDEKSMRKDTQWSIDAMHTKTPTRFILTIITVLKAEAGAAESGPPNISAAIHINYIICGGALPRRLYPSDRKD